MTTTHEPKYLGQSAVAGAAYRCDTCGAHWYPDMGERPAAECRPMPRQSPFTRRALSAQLPTKEVQ